MRHLFFVSRFRCFFVVTCNQEVSIVSDKRNKSASVGAYLKLFFPLQSEADYWLLSDADVSITDMWRTERILPKLLILHFIL